MLVFTEKSDLSALNRNVVALAVIASAFWMFWLSGYMLVFTGEITASRGNFLFNADTSIWIDRIDRVGKPLWTELSISHPLRPWLWGIPARMLAFAFGHYLPHAEAAVAAAKALNAGMFGLAMGMVVLAAMRLRVSSVDIAVAMLFFCFFSSNVIVASTDHFGLSMSMMIASVCCIFLIKNARHKIAVQICFLFFIFGTTITNALIPILNIVFILRADFTWDIRRYLTRRVVICLSLATAVALLSAFVWKQNYRGGSLALSLLNFRWIDSPIDALQYALSALIYPILAPIPELGEHGVTFEPLNWRGWTVSYALAAILWVGLLFEILRTEWKREEPSAVFWILLPWLVFNIAFHNIWGDEYFLFTPHWSWVFLLALILGWRKRFSLFVVGIVAYTAFFQIRFFMSVHTLLVSS